MDNKEIFKMLKHGVSNEWHLENLKRELDSIRERALKVIIEYKELKQVYKKDLDNQKMINDYIDKLEELSHSVQ